MRRSITILALLLLVGFGAGCVTSGVRQPADLAARLAGLGPQVEAGETKLLAETACAASLDLARQYRVVRPAGLQNILVNLGIKDRGLCYHWAEDLEARLRALPISTLELHRAVARRATRREHNALVVTAKGGRFECGIVLDAWRDCGRLYWVEVSRDKYPWVPDVSGPTVPAPQAAQ
jgi:hypothetical protein